MEKTNALDLRQNLGKIIQRLKKLGKPILIEKNREPAAVLISIEDYQRRFADFDADQKREEVVNKIINAKGKLGKGKNSLDLIRELRS